MSPTLRWLWAVAAFVLVTACSSSKATGPSYPQLAGTYAATFAVAATPAGFPAQSFGSAAGTITLNAPASDGSFTGSYLEGGTAGTIAGTEHTDGGIDITQWGNPNVPPLESLAYVQLQLPFCSFANAAGSGTSGSVSGVTLSLVSDIAVPCNWNVSGAVETLTTTIAVTIGGTRG